jgi:hypothetical protein
MIDPLLMFELIQTELRERWLQREHLRLNHAATTPHPRLPHQGLTVVSGLLIAAGQRLQPRRQSYLSWSHECCMLCT